MLGDRYVVWVSSMIKRYLAIAGGAQVIAPGFEELGGAFLLLAVGE